jgi:lipopolysaccharide export system protein LptA
MLLVCLLLSSPVPALESDRDQPIRIQADAAVVDESSGISTYTGNVSVHQGTLHIAAQEVQIHTSQDEVTLIVASVPDDAERLAHYEQRPEENKLVMADARTIRYHVAEERFHLVGDARLTQGEDTFTGEVIHYEADKRRVKSEGGVETIFTPAQRER